MLKNFLIISVTCFLFLSVLAPSALAAGFVPCGDKLDGQGRVINPCQPCHIFALVQNIVTFIWWSAAAIAALMFAYGGFLMIVPGIGGEKSAPVFIKGKKVVTNTLIGIAIVFFAWLAIDTIIKLIAGQDIGKGETGKLYLPWNQIECKDVPPPLAPEALNPSLSTSQLPQPIPTASISGREKAIRNFLAKSGISINKNPCPEGKSYGEVQGGCTNVGTLTNSTINTLNRIKTECGGGVTITGGAEFGHESHGPEKPIVDLAFDSGLASCLKTSAQKYGVTQICTSAQDFQYRIGCSTNEQFRHLHVVFNQ